MLTLLQAQTLASLTPADIAKVYSGRPSASGNHCRCGCRGTYRYNSDVSIAKDRGWDGDPSDVNDKQVVKVLAIVQAHADVADAADDMNWFDVTTADGRSYTIYAKKAA